MKLLLSQEELYLLMQSQKRLLTSHEITLTVRQLLLHLGKPEAGCMVTPWPRSAVGRGPRRAVSSRAEPATSEVMCCLGSSTLGNF